MQAACSPAARRRATFLLFEAFLGLDQPKGWLRPAAPTPRPTATSRALARTSPTAAPADARMTARATHRGGGNRPLRIAHCVIGLADHGNRIDRFPLHEPRMHAPMREWLDTLSRYNTSNDLFLSLDMRLWPSRFDPTHTKFVSQFVGGLANESAPRRPQHGLFPARLNASRLEPMLSALRPTRFEAYEGAPVCSGERQCLCRSLGTARWWEQMAKHEACLRMVREHEACDVHGDPTRPSPSCACRTSGMPHERPVRERS